MPNQPKTPARSVRVGVDLWNAAKAKAAKRGETVTDVILSALRWYVESPVWFHRYSCAMTNGRDNCPGHPYGDDDADEECGHTWTGWTGYVPLYDFDGRELPGQGAWINKLRERPNHPGFMRSCLRCEVEERS